MTLNASKDFLHLEMNCLRDYLSVIGLNTTRRKIEAVARTIAIFEMKLPTTVLSEEHQKKLKLDYENRL